MVLIFTQTTTSLATEFIEYFSAEKLALHLFRVAKETGVEFNKRHRSFSIIGQWKSVIAAHEKLGIILQNHFTNESNKHSFLNKPNLSQEIHCTESDEFEGEQKPVHTLKPVGVNFTPNVSEEIKSNCSDSGESRRGRKPGHTLKPGEQSLPEPLVYIKFEAQKSDARRKPTKYLVDENVKVTPLNNGNLNEPDSEIHIEFVKKSIPIDKHDVCESDAHHIKNVNNSKQEEINEREDDFDEDTDIEEQYLPMGVSDSDITNPTESTEHVKNVCMKLGSSNSNKAADAEIKKPVNKAKAVTKKSKIKDAKHASFKCELCPYVGAKTTHLKNHMKQQHTKKKIACEVCNKKYSKKDIRKHIRMVHEKPKHNMHESIKEENNAEYFCEICTYTGTKKANLTEHMKRMHRNKYSCDVCDKQFGFNKDLNRHKRQVHCDAKYFCEKCHRLYKSKRMYDTHIKTHEIGYAKPNFDCKICEKSFSTKYVLASHIKSEHLGMKKSYLCPTCGQSFTQKNSYLTHANVHAGIKPFVCDICGKAFTYEKSLKEHKYMHDEIRRFQCQICQKKFRQTTSLRIHMRIHRETKDYMCTACGKGFTQKQALLRHERIHSGVKPFACALCGKAFNDNSIIRRHLMLIHKKDSKKWRDHVVSSTKPDKDYHISPVGEDGREEVKMPEQDNLPSMTELQTGLESNKTATPLSVESHMPNTVFQPMQYQSLNNQAPSMSSGSVPINYSVQVSVNGTPHQNQVHYTSTDVNSAPPDAQYTVLQIANAERPIDGCNTQQNVETNTAMRWGYTGYPYYPYENVPQYTPPQ